MKNIMKNILSPVLLPVLFLGLIIAFVLPTPFVIAQEKVTLDILSFGDNASPDGAAMDILITQFQKKYPHVKIKEERLYDEAYHQKVQARLQSGNIPDVLYAWASPRSNALFLSGQAVDLRQHINTKKYITTVVTPTVPVKNIKAGVYVLPTSLGINSVLYVNKALLKQLGLKTPKTYDALVAMLPTIKKAGLTPVAMGNAAAWVMNSTLFGTLVARVTGNANWLKDASNGKYSFTDPKFIKTLEFVKKLYDDGVLSKNSLQVDYGSSLGEFMSKKAVFMIDGHWRLGAIKEDAALLKNIDMIPFPKIPKESSAMASASSGEPSPGYTITKTALRDKNVKKAALDFIEFLVNAEGAQVWASRASLLPALKNAKIDVSEDLLLKKKFYERVKVLANTPDQVLSSRVNEALNSGLQEIGLGAITPQKVAEKMEAAR